MASLVLRLEVIQGADTAPTAVVVALEMFKQKRRSGALWPGRALARQVLMIGYRHCGSAVLKFVP